MRFKVFHWGSQEGIQEIQRVAEELRRHKRRFKEFRWASGSFKSISRRFTSFHVISEESPGGSGDFTGSMGVSGNTKVFLDIYGCVNGF